MQAHLALRSTHVCSHTCTSPPHNMSERNTTTLQRYLTITNRSTVNNVRKRPARYCQLPQRNPPCPAPSGMVSKHRLNTQAKVKLLTRKRRTPQRHIDLLSASITSSVHQNSCQVI